MQTYENNFNRASRLAALPKNLTPEEIVESVATMEQAAPIIDLLNRAVPDFFASEEFADFDPDHKKEIAFSFRILMDMMGRIREFESRTYVPGTDFWNPVVN